MTINRPTMLDDECCRALSATLWSIGGARVVGRWQEGGKGGEKLVASLLMMAVIR